VAVVELFDPLCWVGEPIATEDSEVRESAVLGVSVRWLAKGVNITDEAGFKELNGFVEVIQLLLMGLFLGGKLLVMLTQVCFQGDDQPIDDGSVGRGVQVV